jgi:hypothetical protein
MTQTSVQKTLNSADPRFDLHQGRVVLGDQGEEGRKAFFIQIEARPGQEDEVVHMLKTNPLPAPGSPFGSRQQASASSKPSLIWLAAKRTWTAEVETSFAIPSA